MYKKTFGCLFLSILFSGFAFAQEDVQYSSSQATPESATCSRIHVESSKSNSLAKKSFASAEPYFVRAYNSKSDFAAFQLGKRKGSKVFLYIKLFRFNTCVQDDETLELMLENGLTYSLENKMKVNCNGDMVIELDRKDFDVLSEQPILGFKFLSFDKDFEFHINNETAQKIKEDIVCLETYKF